MKNQKLIQQILKMISISQAMSIDEIELLYKQYNSIDKILEFLENQYYENKNMFKM